MTTCGETPLPDWRGFINNAWFHYAWISNELGTPRILACPDDDTARVARDFSTTAEGGFMNPTFRNHALSYLVGLEVRPSRLRLLVAADRNIDVGGSNRNCSSGVTAAGLLDPSGQRSGIPSRWQPGIHERRGNILLYDGQVLFTSSYQLGDYLRSDWNHVLSPR